VCPDRLLLFVGAAPSAPVEEEELVMSATPTEDDDDDDDAPIQRGRGTACALVRPVM
jgi:hypothetical protein